MLVAQSCPTLCNPTNCSPPGSSVLGILQARILEWVGISFSRGSSQFRAWFQKVLRKVKLKFSTNDSRKLSHGSAGKESACNGGDLGSIPGLQGSPGERKRLPTPVFWPGEFHGLYSPWGHKESDMTECFSLTFIQGITSFSSVAQS